VCQALTLDFVDAQTDFALIHVDFAANANKAHLVGKSAFPFIEVSSGQLEDGDPVYSFGYPLSTANLVASNPQFTIGHVGLAPRVTSAIVSATMERTQLVSTAGDVKVYVLDKALNYGNSGGPIVAAESGQVHAFCSRFQPVMVPQPQIRDKENNQLAVMIPSLYGIVSSLSNPSILEQLRKRGIPVADQ
jgi:serine protease Do